jgi:predicted permease
MVRRKPGVSLAQANADASQAAVKSWNARRVLEPDLAAAEIAKPAAVVSSLKVGAGPDPSLEARTALWVAGVAAIVLLIACANVANLFLARALKRQREFAVRLALGVSRRRLMMQSLIESVVLSLAGATVGVLTAQWGGAAIRRLLIANSSTTGDSFIDWRTLGVAMGIAITSGLLAGVVPALVSGHGDLTSVLKTGGRGSTSRRSRMRTALLLTQGALSVVLLTGAALFVQSMANVQSTRLGYDAEPVLLAVHNARGMRMPDSVHARLASTLLATAQTIPGVAFASWAMTVPLLHTNSTGLFVPGIASVGQLGRFTYQAATTDYFRVMGTRIIRGRGFTADDRAGAPRIAVVSEGMARVLWPVEDAIGQCIRVFADTVPCTTVVGVAEDIAQQELTATQRYHFYLPIEQFAHGGGDMLLIRMRGDAAAQSEAVRRVLQAATPSPSYVTVRPLRELVDGAQRSWRLGATMFAAFGALALLVAAVGLYGVVGYDVAQRMHELGVRVALGAQSGDILRLVVTQAVRFALLGIAIGSALAITGSRWLQPLLFRQSATDPLVYCVVGAVLLLVALLATASPAMRAARADPNVALRAE